MKKPKFNIGDKVIQHSAAPLYLNDNSDYKSAVTVITIGAIREDEDENVYGFEECSCRDCRIKGVEAHWLNVEKNFKLTAIKPKEKPKEKPKVPIKRMAQKDFASALKDIA